MMQPAKTMADQQLRDPSGRLIGTIRQLPDGRLEARNPAGSLCGYYDPKKDLTLNRNGSLVARGNILATLIK